MGKIIIVCLLVNEIDFVFEQILVIFLGVSELKKVFEVVWVWCMGGWVMFLFVDEIYWFNWVQQDSFLFVMEDGIIILVGVIIENLFFELNVVLLFCLYVMMFYLLLQEVLVQLLMWVEDVEDKRFFLDDEVCVVLI